MKCIKGIEICNKKHGETGIYCGRPSPLGNPFKITTLCSRERAIEQYATWLDEKLKEPNSPQSKELYRLVEEYLNCLERDEHLKLLCWCEPEACHLEVIIDRIIEESERPETPIKEPSVREINDAFLKKLQEASDEDLEALTEALKDVIKLKLRGQEYGGILRHSLPPKTP